MLHKKTQANAMLMFLLNRSHNSNQNVLQLRIRLCKTLAIKDHKYESDLKSFVGCCCCWLLVVGCPSDFWLLCLGCLGCCRRARNECSADNDADEFYSERKPNDAVPPPTAHRTSPRPAATFNFNWLLLLRFQ